MKASKSVVELDHLIDAACAGDVAQLRRILGKGHNPHTVDENGYPILALAAVGGHAKAVRELLTRGADLEARGVSYDENLSECGPPGFPRCSSLPISACANAFRSSRPCEASNRKTVSLTAA